MRLSSSLMTSMWHLETDDIFCIMYIGGYCDFLAPLVRMQQSSHANVVWTWLNHPKCHFLNSKKSDLAHFKLRGIFLYFRNEASQWTAKIWIRLNRSTGNFQGPNLAVLLVFANLIRNGPIFVFNCCKQLIGGWYRPTGIWLNYSKGNFQGWKFFP